MPDQVEQNASRFMALGSGAGFDAFRQPSRRRASSRCPWLGNPPMTSEIPHLPNSKLLAATPRKSPWRSHGAC